MSAADHGGVWRGGNADARPDRRPRVHLVRWSTPAALAVPADAVLAGHPTPKAPRAPLRRRPMTRGPQARLAQAAEVPITNPACGAAARRRSLHRRAEPRRAGDLPRLPRRGPARERQQVVELGAEVVDHHDHLLARLVVRHQLRMAVAGRPGVIPDVDDAPAGERRQHDTAASRPVALPRGRGDLEPAHEQRVEQRVPGSLPPQVLRRDDVQRGRFLQAIPPSSSLTCAAARRRGLDTLFYAAEQSAAVGAAVALTRPTPAPSLPPCRSRPSWPRRSRRGGAAGRRRTSRPGRCASFATSTSATPRTAPSATAAASAPRASCAGRTCPRCRRARSATPTSPAPRPRPSSARAAPPTA